MPNGASADSISNDYRYATVAETALPLPWQIAKTWLRLNNFNTSTWIRESATSSCRMAFLDISILTVGNLSGVALHQDSTQVTLPGLRFLSTMAHRNRGNSTCVGPTACRASFGSTVASYTPFHSLFVSRSRRSRTGSTRHPVTKDL